VNLCELDSVESCGKAEELGGSLALDELFLGETRRKLHMKRPRYETDSGFCQVRPILADTSTAMYISILSHEHRIKGKEFLAFKHQLVLSRGRKTDFRYICDTPPCGK
jgi:hypothetical protein